MKPIPGRYRYRPTPTPDCKLYGLPFYFGCLPDWFGLLHACKQTYSESAALPTQMNTFIVHEQAGAERLLKCLSRLRIPITTLHLKVDVDARRWQATPYPDLQLTLPSLKIVEVMIAKVPISAGSELFLFTSQSSIDQQNLMWEKVLKSEQDKIRRWLTNGGHSSLDVVFIAY